ncbi:MAG: hypothetical protein AAFX87_10480 [Bacteroidota bacterium]
MKVAVHLFLILIGFFDPLFAQKSEEARMEMQPQIVAVFPSSDTLPANLLRMYIHFSKPMKPIDNLENIRLIDQNGNEIIGAIFNNAYELWDHKQTQLTLLFDPSRVKTGLKSHEERGRALVNGKRYQLVIGDLQDVDGRTTIPFTKSIVVIEEDLEAPNTDSWVFRMPKADSQTPLIVRFPERLDRLSLMQRLLLTGTENQAIAGRVEITNNETEWRFYPHQNWTHGDYILYVHSRLEDPSGNNLNGLFDHKPGTLKNEREGVIETIKIKITK